jgi:hypothetical protein
MNRLIARIAVLAAAVVVTLTATAVPAAATTWADVWIQSTVGPDRCVAAHNSTSGAAMTADTCADDAKQLWTATQSGLWYTIVNLGTGLCLSNGGTLPGALVVQNTCIAGATYQQWSLGGSGNTFILRNRGANLCMAVPGPPVAGASIVLATCSPGQQWQLLF